MKKILILVFGNLKNDARVTRQLNFLKEKYHVTILCFDAYPDASIEIFKIEKTKLTYRVKITLSILLLLGLHQMAYNVLYSYRKYIPFLSGKFDLILANDIETVPFAFQIAAGKSKIFLDAHEFSPRQFEDRLYWRVFFKRFYTDLCKKYIPRLDGMSTINNGLAKAYESQFGIKPVIITNASNYVDLKPDPRMQYPIRLVHHGIFNFSRQPEIMLEVMKKLGHRFTLDLIYLLPEPVSQTTKKFFEVFKSKALAINNVKILPALKSSEIVSYIHAHYDMGVILIPPVNFNYENGLPNKLFDCIQARLAMAAGPLKEIASITQQYNIGVVAEDFSAQGMFDVLKDLSLEKLNEYKQCTQLAANQMNASYNKILLIDALSKII